jgi:6-pyruvoyltetrahydropterin/6-carboxytetrahydropterin synthase
MFELAVEEVISSGHQLRGYRGRCERCHGHNWRIRLEVAAESLDEAGLAVDFTALKSLLHSVCEGLDHVMLNELPEFTQVNPSAENLARVVHDRCRDLLPGLGRPVRLLAVTVWESPNAAVRYHA